jgi:hypothetical protein
MFDSVQDELVMLDRVPATELVAERLVSTAQVRRQNGQHASAHVFVDSASASGFVLEVRVNDCELAIRPRADDGCTVAMRICGDTVYDKVVIELPARCFTTSAAEVRNGDGDGVCARVLRDCDSHNGFVLSVSLACGAIVTVRPHDDDGKLVAIRLSGDGEYRASKLIEVEMPRHVMSAPDLSTP